MTAVRTGFGADPVLVSLATAHGITPRVAKSWFPPLVRTPRVLVPIELDVLMVRDATLTWAATAMTVPPKADHAANGTTPAAGLMPPPFTNLPAPRGRGAYLHWYLPNGLTAGTADAASNAAQFPPIPDRWLVLRISPGNVLTRRAVRGWVLLAGGEPPAVVDLDAFTETGAAPDVVNALTALGHGDLSWAGYYDNVVNRLGFYDGTIADAQIAGPLAYVVCGWYADPTADPLGDQNVTSLAGFNAKMAQLGWTLDAGQLDEVTRSVTGYMQVARQLGLFSTLDERIAATSASAASPASGASSPDAAYTTTGSWWPSACVFHGAVVGIDWPGSRDMVEAGGPPDPATITVAIGNTMGETIGALVAQANGAKEEASIVEALQLGVIKELDQPDGRAQLDVQVHANAFASRSGGPAATEPVTIAPSGPPQPPPANQPAPGPGIFGAQEAAAGTPPAGAPRHGPAMNLHAREPGELTVSAGRTRTAISEDRIVRGGLSEVIAVLGTGPQAPPSDPGGDVDALRAAPRFYNAKDPIVLVQGAKRAFVHDSGVATEDGMVVCRLTPVDELSWQMPQLPYRPFVRGSDVLERGVENGSVPVECEGILQEAALLDLGSAPAIAAGAAAAAPAGSPAFDVATAQRNVSVEQSAWYATRNPRIDHGPLLAQSGLAGVLPAAFAVAPASRPWTPMHLEWSVEFVASPNGIDDWELDQIDYVLGAKAVVPKPGSGTIFSGRSPLTGGASATLASAVNAAIAQAASVAGAGPVPVGAREAAYSKLSQTLLLSFQTMRMKAAPAAVVTNATAGAGEDVTRGELDDIASALATMDVLSCGLDGLQTQMRGGVPGDGTSTPPQGATPSPFVALRAGFLRIVRLRLVDGFGQFLDLCGSSATQPANGYLVSGPLTVPGDAGVVGLPPRFTAPARAWLRFLSASDDGTEADYRTSPICAFVLPNHLDASLEFFNADGSGAGTLQAEPDGTVTWQDAPGRPTLAGQTPDDALTNAHAIAFARSLIDWGVADASEATREQALHALLRTIDSTLWSVDPFGHAGDEHLSLLVGHPVCLVRGLLRLDVADPVATPDTTVTAIPVRLGDLTQWQDGLLGYFVDDDYTVLHVADAAAPGMARAVGPGQGFLQQINLVPDFYDTFADDIASGASSGATPVTHPYVDTSGIVWIRPNENVNLTMLVVPMTTVHATLGLVPRKEIGMRRAWVQAGLAAIAPTFRFGPVLVDPKHIRMPLATDINGTWVWDYRAAAATWSEDPATNATDDALLGADPPTGIEGWLKLAPPPPSTGPSTP